MSQDSPLVFVVQPGEAGRADLVLAEHFPEASRRRLAALFADGQVRLDGRRIKKGQAILEGQTLSLGRAPDSNDALRPEPEDVPLDVVYEDDAIVAIAKPVAMPCHPLQARERGTVANALVARFPECLHVGVDPREAGLAHRLDTDTSGLLLAARTQDAWQALRDAFAAASIEKSYWAVVDGIPVGRECLEPLLQKGRRVHVDYAGLEAHTSWTEISRSDTFTLLGCRAHTGRMHQVRAHLAHCDSPIVGDKLYGGSAQEGLEGHFLHAAEMTLRHPITGESLTLRAPLPAPRERWLGDHGLALL